MKKSHNYLFIPAIIFFFITLYLFTLPGDDIPQIGWFDKIHGDKLVHFGIFLLLVIIWGIPLFKDSKSASNFKGILLLLTLIAICYGVSIEFIQEKYIPKRSFDIGDIIADSIGSIAGYISLRLLMTKKITD